MMKGDQQKLRKIAKRTIFTKKRKFYFYSFIKGHNLSIGKNNCFSERIRFRERIFLLDRKNRFSYN